MIYNLYIIDTAGCIFNYNFKTTHGINEHLLSGFLSAMTGFAQETFQTGLQTMGIRNGLKLVFYIEPEFKLLFTAIADNRDNNHLLEQLLIEIAQRFIKEKRSILQDEKLRNRIDEYQNFEQSLIEILKFKSKPRNTRTLLFGLFVGLCILIVSSVIIYSINIWMLSVFDENTALLWFLIILVCALSFCCFVSGYIAGNAKMGLFNGILFFLMICIILILSNPGLFLNFLFIAIYVAIACGSAGYAGGLACDKRNLYSLKT